MSAERWVKANSFSSGSSYRKDSLRHFHWPRRVDVGTGWKLDFPRLPWAPWCSQHLRLLPVRKWVNVLRKRVLSWVRKQAPNYSKSILLSTPWVSPNWWFLTFWTKLMAKRQQLGAEWGSMTFHLKFYNRSTPWNVCTSHPQGNILAYSWLHAFYNLNLLPQALHTWWHMETELNTLAL